MSCGLEYATIIFSSIIVHNKMPKSDYTQIPPQMTTAKFNKNLLFEIIRY